MCETKKLYEFFEPGVAEIAKKERIFHTPVDRLMPSAITDALYMRYIKMALIHEQNPNAYPPVDEGKLKIAKEFVKYAAIRQAGNSSELKERNLEYIELTWPAYEAKMRAKPAFAAWVFDERVFDSFYLYSFYIDVDGFLGFDPELRARINPITTYQMDTAYGEYHDVLGNLCVIPDDDRAKWHCDNSSLWRTVRVRGLYASYYMQQAGEGALIADFGGGAFNLLRRYGNLDAVVRLHQRVHGYEIDPNAVSVAQRLFNGNPERYGLYLHNETFFNAFSNPDLLGKTDMIMINGGMSYQRAKTAEILYGAREQLGKPAATGDVPKRLVADWQIKTVDMAHALKTLGLQDQHEMLQPHESIEECRADVESAIKEVGDYKIERVITDADVYGKDSGIASTFVQYILAAA